MIASTRIYLKLVTPEFVKSQNAQSLNSIEKYSDVWSVGCILGEMINNKPMFPGKHYLDQISKIQEVFIFLTQNRIASFSSITFHLQIIGTPVRAELEFITNPKAQQYVAGYVTLQRESQSETFDVFYQPFSKQKVTTPFSDLPVFNLFAFYKFCCNSTFPNSDN